MTFDFGKTYTLDEKLVNGGAVITHEPSGVKFHIARSTNRAYNAAVRAAYRKHEKQLAVAENDKASPEAVMQAAKLGEDLLTKLQAKHILVGWEGTVSVNGVATPYSVEAATTLMGFEEFRNWVMTEADNTENYRKASAKEDEKN